MSTQAASEGDQGREAEAVIVFADIVGCSAISDALGLRDYAMFIGEFHRVARAAAAAVFRPPNYTHPRDFEFSIRGDEACAILHHSQAEDVQRALIFAVALQVLWLTTSYNRQRLAKGTAPVELGIGIHAGAVYIGDFQHGHFSSEGYSINVSKRIEGHTRKGQTSKILVSAQAFAHLPSEERGLTFLTTPLESTGIRGVRGVFMLRELVEIDESRILELDLPQEFGATLLEQILFVAQTREDARWLHVLWRIAYGVANGREQLFRRLLARSTDAARNSAGWFARAMHDRDHGDPNMAAMMFEMAASLAGDDAHSEGWAFYNAALVHEERGAFAASVHAYQKAIQCRPTDTHSQLGLVAGYLRAGRPDEALTFLQLVREELLEDRARAACIYLESVCLEQLAAAAANETEKNTWTQDAASCRAVLVDQYGVQTMPSSAQVLQVGVDGGNVVLKAFQEAKSRTRR